LVDLFFGLHQPENGILQGSHVTSAQHWFHRIGCRDFLCAGERKLSTCWSLLLIRWSSRRMPVENTLLPS
jgi:hypothetical protein